MAREEISAYEREEAYPTQAKLTAIIAVLGIEIGSAEWRALIRTPALDEALNGERMTGTNPESPKAQD